MTVLELAAATGAQIITKTADTGKQVDKGYSCDLLSWVMAHGTAGTAWITVQTHMNVIAVATLHDMACVLIPEGAAVPEDVLAKADEEDIVVLSSPKSAYELCGLMYAAGLKGN